MGQRTIKLNDPLIYGIYAGEEFMFSGTIDDVADKTKMKKENIYWYLTPSGKAKVDRKRKQSDKCMRVVCLGFDDDGEADENFLDNKKCIEIRRKWKKFIVREDLSECEQKMLIHTPQRLKTIFR